jgi:hypothetical protein
MIIQNFRNFTHSRLAYGLSGHHVTVQQLDQLAVILKTALNNPTSASSQTRPSLRLLAFPFRPPAFTALATLSQSPIFITFSYPSFVAPGKKAPCTLARVLPSPAASLVSNRTQSRRKPCRTRTIFDS